MISLILGRQPCCCQAISHFAYTMDGLHNTVHCTGPTELHKDTQASLHWLITPWAYMLKSQIVYVPQVYTIYAEVYNQQPKFDNSIHCFHCYFNYQPLIQLVCQHLIALNKQLANLHSNSGPCITQQRWLMPVELIRVCFFPDIIVAILSITRMAIVLLRQLRDLWTASWQVHNHMQETTHIQQMQ